MLIKFITKGVKTGNLLFFLAYGLFLIAGILSTSFYYKYYAGIQHKVMIVAVLLLLLGKELYENKMTIKSLLSLAIAVGLFSFVKYVDSVSVAVMFILIWSARNIDFTRIAKFTLVISLAFFIFIVLSSYLGVIENAIFRRADQVRYCLGFRYPLYGSAILYNITTLYLYIKKAKIKWIEILALLAINYWIYLQTDSRLSFYFAAIVMALCTILKYFPNILERRRVLCFGMIFSFWLCALISIGLSAFYSNRIPWMSLLNTFLGGRLNLGRNSILEYGVSVFGKNISWHGWGLDVNGEVSLLSLANYNYVDCAYLNVLQHYGVLFLIICLGILTIALLKCYQKNNYYLLILLTFAALHAMIDDLIIYLFYNTLWFVVATPIERYLDYKQNISVY